MPKSAGFPAPKPGSDTRIFPWSTRNSPQHGDGTAIDSLIAVLRELTRHMCCFVVSNTRCEMVLCAPRSLSVDEWARIIRGEYDESPGLSLTRNQAKRLWGLDAETCDAVLERLTKSRYLRENTARMFVRHDDWR